MSYSEFQQKQKIYLERVTPQGQETSIPLLKEKDYGQNFTTVLINSDEIQETLDVLRACAEVQGEIFDEKKEKARLIASELGDLTKEARKEYERFMPTNNPEALFANLSSFYQNGLTDNRNLSEDYQTPSAQEKLKSFFKKEDLSELSEIEKATAFVALEKTTGLFRTHNLRNTDTVGDYHAIFVENKSSNPHGFYASRIASLPEETKEKLAPFASALLPVTHDGGAWHEMVHTLGTEDETKCEGFRFLKTLQTYQEPVLIYPDINARLYNNLNTLETIRKQEISGQRDLEGNFAYIMPKMLLNVMENAERLKEDLSLMSDAQIMQEAKGFSETLSYSKKTETAFREMAKSCPTTESFALKLYEVYQNGKDDKETGKVFEMVNDFVQAAHYLNPSLSKEETAKAFFSASRFKTQNREVGKQAITKQEDFTLSPKEKRHFQKLFDKTKQENPQSSSKELDVLFATAIVRDAWASKRQKESFLENDSTAKDILFSETKSRQYSMEINRLLMTAHHANEIVFNHRFEFENAKYRPPSLQDKLQAVSLRANDAQSVETKGVEAKTVAPKTSSESQILSSKLSQSLSNDR